jgi:hypothetical protein
MVDRETAVEATSEPTEPPQTKPGEQEPAMTSLRAIPEVQTPATEQQSPVLQVSADPLRPAGATGDIPPADPLVPSWGAPFQTPLQQATVLGEGPAAALVMLVDLVGGLDSTKIMDSCDSNNLP